MGPDNSRTGMSDALTRIRRIPTICLVHTLARNSAALALMVGSLAFAEDRGTPSAKAVDLVVEVLKVGTSGTETLATDEARVFLGKGALLNREVTLEGSGSLKGAAEKLRLRAELRPAGLTQAGLAILLKSKVQVLAARGGGPIPRADITRSASLEIAGGASELVTVYESEQLRDKVVLHIRWSEADSSLSSPVEPTPVEFSARVYEVSDSGPTLLADNHLMSVVGKSASTTFDRVVPLPGEGEKRARQDRLDITIASQTLSGGSLSLKLEVSGQIVTLTPEENFSHPLAHQGTYLLDTGESSAAEIEVESDSESREGWRRIRFRVEITALF